MKRNFTVGSLFLLIAIGVASINTASAQVEWGVTAGFNMANMNGKDYKSIPDSSRPKFSGITRIRVGLFADMPLNNYWSFNPGIAYSVKGGVQKLDSGYTELNIPPGWSDKYVTVSNFDFNYIEIPILFRFSTPLGRPTAMYPYENSVKPFYLDFFAGPHISYMLSSKSSSSYTLTRSSSDTTEEFNFSRKVKSEPELGKKVRKLDFGLELGVGFKWRFNRKSYLYLEGRYTLGFMNLNKGYWDRFVQDPKDPTKTIKVQPKITNAGTAHVAIGFITNFSKRRYFNIFKPDRNRP